MLLVTGITGHSGRYFLEELVKEKYDGPIRCLVRDSSDTSLIDNCGLNLEKVIGNLDDKKFVESCMPGINTVMHIAGIFMTPNIVDAAIKNDVERIILVHTTGIFSKYKSAAEIYQNIEDSIQMKLDSTIRKRPQVIILRPTMIYGDMCDTNISVFIKMVDNLRLFPVIDHGSGLVQPVNARDLGRAYYQVLMMEQYKGNDYVLSGRDVISMLDMFSYISRALGKKTYFFNVPVGMGVFFASCLKLITFRKIDYVEKIQRMVEDRCYSNRRAREDFGYDPISFYKGIEIQVNEYLAQ